MEGVSGSLFGVVVDVYLALANDEDMSIDTTAVLFKILHLSLHQMTTQRKTPCC